jgi:hypothetical protein
MSIQPHPLEAIFDIEAGTTLPGQTIDGDAPSVQPILSQIPPALVIPETGQIIQRSARPEQEELEVEERIEDLRIDGQMETIRVAALEAFEAQHRMSQEADPRFSARNAEVAAQYLKIALDTVTGRIDAKYKRAKIKVASKAAGTPDTINNNLIVADRSDILKALRDARGPAAIELEDSK